MAAQGAQLLAGPRVPQLDRLVKARRGQHLAVRGKRHAPDVGGIVGRLDIPDGNRHQRLSGCEKVGIGHGVLHRRKRSMAVAQQNSAAISTNAVTMTSGLPSPLMAATAATGRRRRRPVSCCTLTAVWYAVGKPDHPW